MAQPMAQQTGAPRFEVQGLRAVYDTGDSFWSARVVDASETGVFLETTHDLNRGETVEIMFELPETLRDASDIPLFLDAKVVRLNYYDVEDNWNRKHGVGLAWQDLSLEQTEQLRDFLAQHGVRIRH